MIVVNPLRELGLLRFRLPSDWRSFLFGSDVCDLYLQPNVGGDVALFKALLQGLIEADAIDRDFVETATTGWPEVEADVGSASRDELARALDLQVGGRYVGIGEYSDIAPPGNGDDALLFEIGLSLPVWGARTRARGAAENTDDAAMTFGTHSTHLEFHH